MIAFLFLGSRDTIDDPSINEGGGQTTIEAPATTTPVPTPGSPRRPSGSLESIDRMTGDLSR